MKKAVFVGDADSSRDVWPEITRLAKKSGRRIAAVAFVNGEAMAMLPLRGGDVLKTDMSEWRVSSGLSNPHKIQEYYDAGVEVYSCKHLHAKVFIFDDSVVVGSANVSNSSRDALFEGGLISSDPGAIKAASEFVKHLEGERVSQDYLDKCKKLYKPAWFSQDRFSADDLYEWCRVVTKKVGSFAERPQHGHFVKLNYISARPAVAQGFLRGTKRMSGKTAIRLELYPGDTRKQGTNFFERVDMTKLLALAAKGWTLIPNFHFGHAQRGYGPHFKEDRALKKYLSFWEKKQSDIRRVERAEWEQFMKWIYQQKLLPTTWHVDLVEHKRTKFQYLDVRPGLLMQYFWPIDSQLPKKDSFAVQVRQKINQALTTWGDQF